MTSDPTEAAIPVPDAGTPAVLEPECGDGKARGVTREWAAAHPEGPEDWDG